MFSHDISFCVGHMNLNCFQILVHPPLAHNAVLPSHLACVLLYLKIKVIFILVSGCGI